MFKKILYLGPQGSYSEIATKDFLQYCDNNVELMAIDSIYKIVKRLKEFNSEDVVAIIPIENSVEGVVRETQDNLLNLAKNSIRIYAESCLTIEHSLISFGKIEDITTIASHPQALAQCREYINKTWGDNITLQPVLSTSNAVSSLTPEAPHQGAISNEYCAKIYNVPVIENKINDRENNTTRFVLLSKKVPKKSQTNKVSITFSTENKAGALNKVLNILEKYGLNMSYIDSRPSRKELGEYVFYIDFAGHIEDSNVNLALIEIQSYVKMFEILSEGAICV